MPASNDQFHPKMMCLLIGLWGRTAVVFIIFSISHRAWGTVSHTKCVTVCVCLYVWVSVCVCVSQVHELYIHGPVARGRGGVASLFYILYTVFGHVCFLFNFTHDQPRPHQKCGCPPPLCANLSHTVRQPFPSSHWPQSRLLLFAQFGSAGA